MVYLAFLQRYAHSILPDIPWPHWVVMGILSLALVLYFIICKRHSVYGTICLGLTVFLGLFLLDAAVLSRLISSVHPETKFDLVAEFNRFVRGGEARWTEMLVNVVAFIPFGIFLSEFLSTKKRFIPRHRLARVTLAAFSISLCIECLQLLFHVGVFEITDLALNTMGGVVGASLAMLISRFLRPQGNRNDK